ncbi:MAG: hypothetical protein HYX52_05630 [Chloroflexi bacterium]|nr:hypothetical protein [Chloroflexota bacterium]
MSQEQPRYPVSPESERIAYAFDAFADTINPFPWSNLLWERYLDNILAVLQEHGHYPKDEYDA